MSTWKCPEGVDPQLWAQLRYSIVSAVVFSASLSFAGGFYIAWSVFH